MYDYAYYNRNKSLKCYAKWKRPIIKDHIVYEYTYMPCGEQASL